METALRSTKPKPKVRTTLAAQRVPQKIMSNKCKHMREEYKWARKSIALHKAVPTPMESTTHPTPTSLWVKNPPLLQRNARTPREIEGAAERHPDRTPRPKRGVPPKTKRPSARRREPLYTIRTTISEQGKRAQGGNAKASHGT